MNTSTQKALVASSLTVNFGDQQVLKKISFNVKEGEVFALLGGNGAGKSTVLKAFIGTVIPAGGDAQVMGLSVKNNLDETRKNIAYLPESVMLYGHLSGIENIKYFLSLAKMNCSSSDVEAALLQVALQQDAWHRKLSSYSKGMRQKTAIALALLRNAPILLLDEPTSGLDPGAIDEFNELISNLALQGKTVVMVTHDLYGACQIAHRINLIHDGEIAGTFERSGNVPISTEDVHLAFSRREML